MSARPFVSDEQRRTRLLRRHRLATETRAGTVVEAADAMVGLHATTPSTVYLSAWARVAGFTPDAMSAALYDDRTLIKQLAMRRTLFVFPRPVLADAVGAIGRRGCASERTNMLRDLRRSDDFDDPEGWIDAASAAVLDELSDGSALTSSQLRDRLPALDGYVTYGVGTSWEARTPMGPRVLNMMSAAGEIVRGPNGGGWHVSRPSWALMSAWLGEPLPDVDAAQGHRAMIARWLRSFGPGTETDLVWWLGSTKTAVRAALADLDVVEVDLAGGRIGYLHADDVDADDPVEPCALLLPELDPTTMGHKEREFYVGDHVHHVFDSNGNGGQTAWWDGRIVGGWSQREDGTVRVSLFEDVPAAARTLFDRRAEELSMWLGAVRPRPGYPAPFMRRDE